MPDGRIDGHFVLNTNIETSIRNELGLSEAECKQMGSVWNAVLNEANNSANFETNNNNTNNTNNQLRTMIKFTKECWTRIVDMVNKALKSFSDKQIQAEEADEFHDNINLGELAIQQFNKENPLAESFTYYNGLEEYLTRYGNSIEKLSELKSNPQYADLAKYMEDYQAGKISIKDLQQKASELYDNSIESKLSELKTNPQYADLAKCMEDYQAGKINIKNLLQKASEFGNGNGININCGPRARIIQTNLAQQGIPCEIINLCEIENIEVREDEEGKYLFMPRPEHAFCVIGLDKNADTTDPSTWGENAVIVDAWLGKTFSVKEGIDYYKEFFRYNDNIDENGNIKEYKMSFGTLEQLHERLPQME